MSTPREIAKQIIDDWNSGDESTIDQQPANPDGPYFQHLEDRITAALTRSEEGKNRASSVCACAGCNLGFSLRNLRGGLCIDCLAALSQIRTTEKEDGR